MLLGTLAPAPGTSANFAIPRGWGIAGPLVDVAGGSGSVVIGHGAEEFSSLSDAVDRAASTTVISRRAGGTLIAWPTFAFSTALLMISACRHSWLGVR